MYEKLNLFNGTILNSQHLAHIEDGIANNSKAVEKNVAVAVETSYNQQTHVITFKVKNALGEIISTSTIDLPTESAIININDIVINGKKYLRFTTVNGSTFDVEMDEMFVNLVNEETFSNAIKNINEQILQLQTDVATSKNDISNLKSFAENTNKSLANLEQTDIITNKRLANLESATLDFIEDSAIAYQKTVPENALPYAKVTKIGGMTRKCTNLIPFTYKSQTVNGITFTVNDDGTVTANGTATSDATFSTESFTILANKTYQYTGCPTGGSESTYYVRAMGFGNDYGIGIVISCPYDFDSAQIITIKSGYTANNLLFKPMVNEGDTALPYEPYFEGLRSAPVSELVSEGVNIWDEEWYNASLNENTGAFTVSSNADVSSKNYIPVIPNTQYYNSMDCWIAFYDKNKAFISASSFSMGGFTTPSNCYFMKFQTLVGKYGLVYKNDIIIAKGSTALPYHPYFKRTLPIPEAVRSLEEYGEGLDTSYLNQLDFTKQQYIQWVRRLLPSEKTLSPVTTYIYNNIVYYQLTKTGTVDKNNASTNILVSNIRTDKRGGEWDTADRIGTVTGAATYEWYWFGFAKGTTLEQAQAIIDESEIIVTLAEPEVTDISDILTDDNFIEVEGGGSITAVNEFGYDVPTTINYITDIGE